MSNAKKYQNEVWLNHQYIELKKSKYRIAKEIGCSPSTIAIWLGKFGIPTRNHKLSCENRFRNHPDKYLYKGKYYRIRNPNYDSPVYIFEHDAIIEKKLGRKLNIRKEWVHHINFNGLDNSEENLILLTPSHHVKAHKSFGKLALRLFEKGIIYFDKEKNEYKITI